MKDRKGLSEHDLERIVEQLVSADGDLSKISAILSTKRFGIIGNTVEYAVERHRDALDDIMGSFNFRVIFDPVTHLYDTVKRLEGYSELEVDGYRVLVFAILNELGSIVSHYEEPKKSGLMAALRDSAIAHKAQYEFDEINGRLYRFENGTRVQVDLNSLLSSSHEKPDHRIEPLIGRLNSLTELLNILDASTGHELARMPDTEIPRFRLHVSFEAFYDIKKQVHGIERSYRELLKHMGISPRLSKSLKLISHARVPWLTSASQYHREWIITHAPQMRVVKGANLTISAGSALLGFTMGYVGVLAGIAIASGSDLTERTLARYRGAHHRLHEVNFEEYEHPNHHRQIDIMERYSDALFRRANDYFKKFATDTNLITDGVTYDMVGVNEQFQIMRGWQQKDVVFDAKEAKGLYVVASHAFNELPAEIRHSVAKESILRLIREHPIRASIASVGLEMGLIDLNEAHEAAYEGFNTLYTRKTHSMNDPLIPIYINLGNLARKKELYNPENMKFEKPTTIRMRVERLLSASGMRKGMPFVSHYEAIPVSG